MAVSKFRGFLINPGLVETVWGIFSIFELSQLCNYMDIANSSLLKKMVKSWHLMNTKIAVWGLRPNKGLRRAIFYTLLYVVPKRITRIFVMNPADTFGKISNPDLLPILVRFLVQEGTEDMARRAHNLYTSKTSSNELEKKMCPAKIVARHMET